MGGPADGDRIPDVGPLFRIPIPRVRNAPTDELSTDLPIRVGAYVRDRMLFARDCRWVDGRIVGTYVGRQDVYRWMGEE